MSRRSSLLVLCIVLSGCSESVDERLAELDARASVDCGYVSECDVQADAEAVVACLGENLRAGIEAKAVFILGLDPVAYVYAFDGCYIAVEGYCIDPDDCYFTESICRDVMVSGEVATCTMAGVTDCQEVRDWGYGYR